MAGIEKQHHHNQNQIVVATADNAKFIRDHKHRADQIYAVSGDPKERGLGKNHLHTASQVT